MNRFWCPPPPPHLPAHTHFTTIQKCLCVSQGPGKFNAMNKGMGLDLFLGLNADSTSYWLAILSNLWRWDCSVIWTLKPEQVASYKSLWRLSDWPFPYAPWFPRQTRKACSRYLGQVIMPWSPCPASPLAPAMKQGGRVSMSSCCRPRGASCVNSLNKLLI